jgi:hypothetical protein
LVSSSPCQFVLLLLPAVSLLSTPQVAAADPTPVGVVSHVKVLSDKIEDVSSLAAWKKSFIKDGMSDEEKALAIWESVLKFRHQDAPPQEHFAAGCVHDPIKTFNVYGYGMCCCASCNVEALARYLGMQARGWGIQGHSVPEVSWNNGKTWHMLDASLLTYFPKADGQIAGVGELVAGVRAWFAKNRGYQKNEAKLREFMRAGGWKKGPEILSRCPFYDDNGWFMAATHGWYSTMQEYDQALCKPFVYEYGYSQGYQVNIQLRKGESLTRHWSNKGLHVNMDGNGDPPGCLTTIVGDADGDLRYSPQYGDLAPGRIGNGTLTYEAPLADPDFALSALTFDNLVESIDKEPAAVHVKDKDRAGVLVVRMPSSYVYLTGQLAFNLVVGRSGSLAVTFSENHGRDWKEIANLTTSGDKRIDLKPFVFRRYDYRLKFTFMGAGTGLNSLKIVHDIQHSQRPLPALAQGKNNVTFQAGPQEGTITVEGSTDLEAKGKQLLSTDFHPLKAGIQNKPLMLKGREGHLTFPIATPGDMVRLRFGCHYGAIDAQDGWDLQVSFDGGKSFKKVDRCAASSVSPNLSKYVTFADIPAGTRAALVRFAGTQRNTACLFDFRIDADYQEPQGGFRPIKVTYRWEENDQMKQDGHVAKQARAYVITCAAKPRMKSITLEWGE